MNNHFHETPRHDWASLYWSLGLVLLAAGIRFYRLGDWSFWEDEIFTVRDARNFPDSLTINPIPYAAIALMLRLFGESEFAARLAPALVGTASVPLVEWAGRRMFGMWAGRIAALLVALSPWHLFWSQNARHYAFTFFFATLAVTAFYLAVERNQLGWTFVSIGSTLATGLSHTLAGTLVLGLLGYAAALILWRKRLAPPSGFHRIVLAFAIPFVFAGLTILVIPACRQYLTSGWGLNLWARNPLYLLMTFAHGVTLPVCFVAAWHLLTPLPLSLWREEWGRAKILIWCAFGFPFAFLIIGSLFQNVAGYYLFFTTPMLFLAVGAVCGHTMTPRPSSTVHLGWLIVGSLSMSLIAGDILYFTTEQGGRTNWKSAMRALDNHVQPKDTIVSTLPEVGQYYQKTTDIRWTKFELFYLERPALLYSHEEPDKQIFVVVEAKEFETLDPSGEFRRWLDAHAHRVVHVPAYARASDRSVEVFRLDPPIP